MTKVERKGTKHDTGKPDPTLIPREAIIGAASALTFGASKYGRNNFKAGIEYTALAAAAMRHLIAWLDRENLDPESGLSHLDHCLASLCMLKFMEQRRPEMDNRYIDEVNNASE